MHATKNPKALIITRFAPSPTGPLHEGHFVSAAFARDRGQEIADKSGCDARFILRIEDIDQTRCLPVYTNGILADLAARGFTWEKPVRIQSEHMNDYKHALNKLSKKELLYPCFCTRKQIQKELNNINRAPHADDIPPPYPGTCRRLSNADRESKKTAGIPYALRLNMTKAISSIRNNKKHINQLRWHEIDIGWITATPEIFGDVILARKDTPTSYHVAVTVDDAIQGVTLVTRGIDLRSVTHIHCLLQALLDLPTPQYQFHPLVFGRDGKKLSKRSRTISLL